MLKVIITENTSNNTLLSIQMNKGDQGLLLELVKSTLKNTGEVMTQDINNLTFSNKIINTGFGTEYELTIITL